MHRVERLFVRIQYKDLAHTCSFVCSCEPPVARVMVASTRFSGGTPAQHWLHPLHLFNRAVLALQAGLAPEGRNLNACLENVGSVSSLSLLMSRVYRLALGRSASPRILCGGS